MSCKTCEAKSEGTEMIQLQLSVSASVSTYSDQQAKYLQHREEFHIPISIQDLTDTYRTHNPTKVECV